VCFDLPKVKATQIQPDLVKVKYHSRISFSVMGEGGLIGLSNYVLFDMINRL
jgi:hypothetical protein